MSKPKLYIFAIWYSQTFGLLKQLVKEFGAFFFFFLSSYINNTKFSPLPLSVSFHLPFLTLFYCLDEVPSFIFYIFYWFF